MQVAAHPNQGCPLETAASSDTGVSGATTMRCRICDFIGPVAGCTWQGVRGRVLSRADPGDC